jgi:predicted glycoside hydrolase/deacetylase ChbG (UPF0249 family)
MFEKEGKKIIVSADDFGISQRANENILKLARERKLDRVEIMVSHNLKQEHVLELIASGVKLDIHFHLVKDRLDYWQNNQRKIEKQTIKRIIFFLFNYFFGDTRPKIVKREWESQLKDFKILFGKYPDGASSHEHIHFFPAYFKVFLKLASKYSIPYIRFGKNTVHENNRICVILNWLRKINARSFKESGLNTSDYMASFDWLESLESLLEKIPENKIVEVVFHPELDNEFQKLESMR